MGLIKQGEVPKGIQEISRYFQTMKKEDPVLWDIIKDKPINVRFDNIDMNGKKIS